MRNALDAAVSAALAYALDTLDDDPGLRVGVLTGAGGNFSSGRDLKAFGRGERPVIEGRSLAGLTERPPRKPRSRAMRSRAVDAAIAAAEDAREGALAFVEKRAPVWKGR